MERSNSCMNLLPGYEDTENREKGSQQDKHQVDAIQPEAIMNAKAFNPRMILCQQPFPGGPGVSLEVRCEEQCYEEEIRQ